MIDGVKYPDKERPQGRRKDDDETSLETSRQVKAGRGYPAWICESDQAAGIDGNFKGSTRDCSRLALLFSRLFNKH